jgi:hypothetical protein
VQSDSTNRALAAEVDCGSGQEVPAALTKRRLAEKQVSPDNSDFHFDAGIGFSQVHG